jgi:hypothetical protein
VNLNKKPVLKKSISTPNIADKLNEKITEKISKQHSKKTKNELKQSEERGSGKGLAFENPGRKEEVWEELFYYYYENFLNQALDAMQKKMERDTEENGGKRIRSQSTWLE